jgi:myo-inositol-1(or 4)-monophosphatase
VTHQQLPTNEELLTSCVGAAEEAAELLRTLRRQGRVDVTATKSSPTDVVTNADQAAEDLLRRLLVDRERGDRWLGEESGAVGAEDGGGLRWIVDPLDGTVNYLYGLPGWAVSVAVERGSQIVAGCVVLATQRQTFAAIRGSGATCDGDAVQVSQCADLSLALVATGFSYEPAVREQQGSRLAHLLPRVRDIRRNGSAATDFCSLAAGRVDAFYEAQLQPWDRAAGALIAREAGAHVEEAEDGSVVAANLNLWELLSAELAVAGW